MAGLALKLRDENLLQGIIGQLLNIPAVCHPDFFPSEQYELKSYEQNSDAPTINGRSMRWFWSMLSYISELHKVTVIATGQYFPNANPDHLASPLLAVSHSGLPPTREI